MIVYIKIVSIVFTIYYLFLLSDRIYRTVNKIRPILIMKLILEMNVNNPTAAKIAIVISNIISHLCVCVFV